MLYEAFLLIPGNGLMTLLAGLDIQTTVYEERILTIHICLTLRSTRVTFFHGRIGVTVTGFPVFAGSHMVLKGRTEQLGPVDFLLALLIEELDIVGIRQLQESFLFLILLRVEPTFAIGPQCMTFLEVLGLDFFLQHSQLFQLQRVLHFQVILEIRRVIDEVIATHHAGFEALFDALHFLELIRLTECEECLEGLILQRLLIATDTARVDQLLESRHLFTLVRIHVFTLLQRMFGLLEVAAFHQFLQFQILCQLGRFLNLTPAFNARLQFTYCLLESIGREHFTG